MYGRVIMLILLLIISYKLHNTIIVYSHHISVTVAMLLFFELTKE